MTTADDKLRSFFADEDPSGADAAFVFAVEQALARRQLQLGMLVVCGWATLAAVLLWTVVRLAGPLISSGTATLTAAAPMFVLVTSAGCWAAQRARRD